MLRHADHADVFGKEMRNCRRNSTGPEKKQRKGVEGDLSNDEF
jgi:hypothetical protein